MKDKFYWLNDDSRLFLQRGYLKDGQSPEERIKEIAESAEKRLGISGFAEKFYDYMSRGFYSLATPVWCNYGNDRGLPVSCFGGYVSDTMQSILYKASEVGMMSKFGGGTSAYFGDLRHRGAPISVGGSSSGAVHFMELFDKVADTVSQGNSRRGSFAAYLPVEHPDILEFLRIRADGHPIQNMSFAVTITDEWMSDMIGGNKEKRKIWAKIIEKRFESGYPYITFIDNVNTKNPQVYIDKGLSVKAQNLCVTGDQRVVTNRGMLTAKELYEEGGDLILFDNEKAVNSSPMHLVEKMADVYEIELENGITHKITSYHKVKVRTSDTLDTVVKTADIACADLKVGDLVAVQTKKGLFGDFNKKDEAFLLGLNQSKNEVPDWIWHSNEDTQRFYIRGLLLPNIGKGLIHSSKKFLQDVQLILMNLGINCALKLKEDKGVYTLYGLNNDLDSTFHKIKSINYVGKEDVYCVTVNSENHHWICNGVVTHNCNEITLHSDEENSFVCVLSSLNLLHWEEIKNTDAIETMIYFLESVNDEFVEKSENLPFMRHAYNFAKEHRALGLGVLGWHSYLQYKNIAFDSMEANLENASIFKTISERCNQATRSLAEIYGETDLLKGYGVRNTHTMAIAPTTSSSFILGQVSPSIEPLNSNYFVKKLAKGNFTYKNPFLIKLLKQKGKNSNEVWKSILTHGGSVQHLEFLDDHEKNVFKTFAEISPKQIVIQAAQRQKYIDQGQSLNIMIEPSTKAKLVSELMIFAWQQGIKGLYYQRGGNPSQKLSREIMNCSSCEG
jgi:ribonucleotide reductase alpha subunit